MADNEILEQQRKARENFLKLKKMQQGEIAPEPKPSEIAMKPKTFKEKIQNFWFHYKWHTITLVFMTVVISILCAQCANREEYDFEVVYFAYNTVLDAQLDSVEEYLESYATDIDGNGEVNVNIINCSFSENSTPQYKNTVLAKIQTQIVGNRLAVMYIMDDKAYEYLNNAIQGGVFPTDKLAFGEDFYNKTLTEEYGKLPEGLGVSLRLIEGTTFEGDKKVEAIYKESEKVIEKIKNEP